MHTFSSKHSPMYLLAGLVAILGITTVEALPVQPPEFLDIYRRTETALHHPLPNQHSFLFHGTTPLEVQSVIKKPLLSKTHNIGDLHCNDEGSDGGFYLTDSAMAAAQFVCWGDKKLGSEGNMPARVRVAHVLRFEWSPGPEVRSRVTTLEEQTSSDETAVNQLCRDQDVLSGPMKAKSDADLTPYFWQYAIVRQEVLDKYLVYKDTIKINCEYVPKKGELTSDMYAKTQHGNPNFDALMNGKELPTASSSKTGGGTSAPKSPAKSSPPPSPKTAGKISPPASKPAGKISPPSSPKPAGKISPPASPKSPVAQAKGPARKA